MNYLIYGTSYNLIDNEIGNIVGNKKYSSVSLSDVAIESIIEDLNYSSMFDEDKVVVVRNFEILLESKKEKNSDIEKLLEYLSAPNDRAILILISSTKLNERLKITKELQKYLKVVATPVISKSYELSNVLGDIIKKDGYAISQNVLNVFSTKCASNLDIAIMEFNKLKMIKRDNKLISEKDVEDYVCNYNSSDIFEFKDAVLNKNISKAFQMIEDMENSKMDIVLITVMLAKEYETLSAVKSLVTKRMTNDEISRHLDNMHPYRVKILREISQRYTMPELEKDLLYLCNLDLKLISKDNTGYDEIRKFLLEL